MFCMKYDAELIKRYWIWMALLWLGLGLMLFNHFYDDPLPVWLEWIAILAMLVAIAMYFVRVSQMKRFKSKGCCIICGYDLRGNPDTPACPECGMEIDRRG